MPRKCTVCTNERRVEIDLAILQGKSYRHIAAQFGGTSFRSVSLRLLPGERRYLSMMPREGERRIIELFAGG